MKFDNTFDLPIPPDRAWVLLLDVPRIVPCMPGAELVEIESETSFKGRVSVRLGPVALVFSGRAVIEAIDNVHHTARIKAQGLDAKGRGGASAVVDFKLVPAPQGSRVVISTDLTLSGGVAQYGRGAGIIREVAAQLTQEFSAALRRDLIAEEPAAATVEASATAQPPSRDAAPPPRAISGFSLVWRVFVASLRNAFGLGKRG
jgi:carbon monoxide dehydrogenase subunit G